jgi:hypothetical protein
MPKLTDAELGDLLRETFADREHLIDHVPEATEPARGRGPLPALLAAAAVLAVVAGVLYGVSRIGAAAPEQPAATPSARTADDDARIWAASLNTMLRTVRPAAGWRSVIVLDLSDVGADHVRKGPPISRFQRVLIIERVYKTASVDFHGEMSPAPPSCADSRVGVVQIADVVGKGDHAETEISLFHDCKLRTNAKYRLERTGTRWAVTETLSTRTVTW